MGPTNTLSRNAGSDQGSRGYVVGRAGEAGDDDEAGDCLLRFFEDMKYTYYEITSFQSTYHGTDQDYSFPINLSRKLLS